MSLTKLLTDLANIQRLDDEPNDVGGLTSSELKETFDKAGIDIQGFINNTLIPELEAQFDETGLNTLASAVEYTNEKTAAERAYTDGQVSALAFAATAYTNEKAAIAEQNANAYTGSAVSSAITTASADATAKANAAEQSAKNASIPVSQKGAVNGVASLDASGKVPSTQMPAMNYDPLGSASVVQGNLNAHAGDVVKHITAGERTTWNAKQNALTAGTDYATPAQLNSEATARAAADSALAANKAELLIFSNKSVAPGAWTSNATYPGFGYRAAVPCTGVAAGMIPNVTLAPVNAISGIFAPVSDSYAGGVYIYASEIPGAAITIPTITAATGKAVS